MHSVGPYEIAVECPKTFGLISSCMIQHIFNHYLSFNLSVAKVQIRLARLRRTFCSNISTYVAKVLLLRHSAGVSLKENLTLEAKYCTLSGDHEKQKRPARDY